MGGKRPDQHNIDPGEAGSTNYAWRGEGRSQEEKVKNEDKQRRGEQSADERVDEQSEESFPASDPPQQP